mgnify:CR=1 FL=1
MLKSAVAGLSRVANTLSIILNAAGTLTVLILVAVLNFDVIARGIFNAPLKGAYELVQFSVVFIVFLQLADVVRVDRLTRSDGFLNVVHNRSPRTAATMRRIINAISAIFMGLITYTTWPEFLHMWETQDYFGVPGLFTLPWWPVKLIIVLSSALCSILFLLKVLLPSKKKDVLTASDKETSA